MDGFLTTPLLEKQGGVISRAQLLGFGVSEDTIDGWLRREWLLPLYRGVYAVGHRVLTFLGLRWAAVLAGGDGTVLSHRTAASVWDLWLPGRDVDVISPRRLRQEGIRGHRHRLHPGDVKTTDDGLPVTTPERTLVDLSDVLNPRKLEQAYDRARLNRLLSLRDLETTLARAHGRHGAPALTRIIGADRPTAATANDFEAAFLRLIRSAGLPERPAQSRKDKRRDAQMLVQGWRTVRFSYHDVIHDPAFVLSVLRPLLT
jgi:hypothetical protein